MLTPAKSSTISYIQTSLHSPLTSKRFLPPTTRAMQPNPLKNSSRQTSINTHSPAKSTLIMSTFYWEMLLLGIRHDFSLSLRHAGDWLDAFPAPSLGLHLDSFFWTRFRLRPWSYSFPARRMSGAQQRLERRRKRRSCVALPQRQWLRCIATTTMV